MLIKEHLPANFAISLFLFLFISLSLVMYRPPSSFPFFSRGLLARFAKIPWRPGATFYVRITEIFFHLAFNKFLRKTKLDL